MPSHERPLGRRKPLDFEHITSYPLSALPLEAVPTGVPVVIGVDWYSNFDVPVRDGSRFWIGRGSLGSVRGGHCVCIKSVQPDYKTWYPFYDQGSEGACVGFGCSRMMSLLNRSRYEARWLWDRAKEIDEWGDTNPGDSHGTSVRAALDILATRGHVPWRSSYAGLDHLVRAAHVPVVQSGIAVYRWATTVDEVLSVIALPKATQLGAVPILNSWGIDYPKVVWMPGETLQKLIDADGEVGLVTDR